jgi:ORF6N domain.
MPIQASLIVATLANCGFYTIRGVKVMLDADLAEIYGYSRTVREATARGGMITAFTFFP